MMNERMKGEKWMVMKWSESTHSFFTLPSAHHQSITGVRQVRGMSRVFLFSLMALGCRFRKCREWKIELILTVTPDSFGWRLNRMPIRWMECKEKINKRNTNHSLTLGTTFLCYLWNNDKWEEHKQFSAFLLSSLKKVRFLYSRFITGGWNS